MATRRVFKVKQAPREGSLDVKVVDDRGDPVANAYVSVYPLGAGQQTGADGHAVFDKLPPGTSDAGAGKAGHGAEADGAEGRVQQDIEIEAGKRATLTLTLHRLPKILTENIVIVGSERHYESFGLKMMFIAPAFAMISRDLDLRPADVTTVLFVDAGYTRHEKLALEYLSVKRGVKIVPIASGAAIVSHFNARPTGDTGGQRTKTLVQDVAIFCHGFESRLMLNLGKLPTSDVEFGAAELKSVDVDVFVPGGRVFSYACRTGVAKSGEEFANDAAAEPEHSLAQKMADHFGVDVFAYLTRTWYGEVLASEGDFDRLAKLLKAGRDAASGGVVALPPEHEALPHESIGGARAWLDGTKDYVLWRKLGAIAMPYGHSTPKGLSQTMRRFAPYE